MNAGLFTLSQICQVTFTLHCPPSQKKNAHSPNFGFLSNRLLNRSRRFIAALLHQSKSPHNPALLITEFLGAGGVGHVYRGHLTYAREEHLVVAKVTQDIEHQTQLHQEAKIYNALSKLWGLKVPQVHGLYHCEGMLMLLMQCMGNSITTFQELSPLQL